MVGGGGNAGGEAWVTCEMINSAAINSGVINDKSSLLAAGGGSHGFRFPQALHVCVLVVVGFEVDTVKVKEIEEVAVSISTLGFGTEWGNFE